MIVFKYQTIATDDMTPKARIIYIYNTALLHKTTTPTYVLFTIVNKTL